MCTAAPGTHQSSYGAAKAGLDQLSRVLAMELARKQIRVNGIASGYFATEMNEVRNSVVVTSIFGVQATGHIVEATLTETGHVW